MATAVSSDDIATETGLEMAESPQRPTRPELTVRSLAAGAVVAVIMGAAYPYMVLKLGFGPNVSIVSAFFGFIILNLVGRGEYDRWRNNIVQTAGTSAAQTAFMCGVLASFDMLRASSVVKFHLNPTPLETFIWLTCASLLGVLLAAPMRRHFIVDEKLPFPDGMAAAETLMVLDPPGGDARGGLEWRRARLAAIVLGLALIASAAVMLIRDDAKIFELIPEGWDPGALTLGAAGASFVLASMGVGAAYSLLSVGSGMIVGFRVTLWLMVGCIIGWVVAPYLLIRYGLLPDHAPRLSVLYWVMWPGIGMIMAGGLTALLLRWRLLIEAFKALGAAGGSGEEFPLRWTVIGVIVLTVLLCVIQKAIFGLPFWMTFIAILFSVPLMLVGLRALGETNWGPIGALSNLMQGVFALVAPGNVNANILGAGATGTIAVTSEGLVQDYKAGWMIGSTPRSMTIAQLMGAPIGAAVLAVVYPALVKTYGLIGPHAELAAPGSRRTAGFAELLSAGVDKLPASAMWAMLAAIVAGVVLAMMEAQPRLRKWTPSPTGLSLGVLLPFSAVAAMFVGAAGGSIWLKFHTRTAKVYSIPLASGFIAGEAMVAVIVPVLLWLHLGKG
ncbi:MAG TPA: OPT family oligopeptide transporter [Caulobacteraceae bacterium]